MCALLFGNCAKCRGGAKSSEMKVDDVRLLKLNRANFECSVTQPRILMQYQILDIVAMSKNQHFLDLQWHY